MTALSYKSFDLNTNSDSDDDFMVDSIIPENSILHNRNGLNKNSVENVICRSLNDRDSFPSLLKMTSKSQKVSRKFPIKRNISDTSLHYSKLFDFESNGNSNRFHNKYSKFNFTIFDKKLKRDQDSMSATDAYECNSNIPSPFVSSDQTHSIESSSTCTLYNDPIITSVVLNEDKKFNNHQESHQKLPTNRSYFNNLKTSFDKSSYSTSIDDNLLRPIRQKQFICKDLPTINNVIFVNQNQSIQNSWYGNISKIKRCRSTGLDEHSFTYEKDHCSTILYPIKISSTSLILPTQNPIDTIHSSIASTVASSMKKLSQTTVHNKRKHLLQFIIDLLKEGHSCVNWSNKREKEFFIAQPEKLALLWAGYKNNNRMTFDSLARSLRLYYAPKKLERITGKKNHYRILNMSEDVLFKV